MENGGLQDRLEMIKSKLADACGRSGRNESDVEIVAVAKGVGYEAVDEAVAAGIGIIGENRIQEAAQKIPLCTGRVEWHMIGHLQSNKVRNAVGLFSMIHSVDSLKILRLINEACVEEGRTMPVCLEVNVSGEASKQGFAPVEVPAVLEQCRGLMNVDVLGLMTIPPFTEDPEGVRPYFRKLRELRDEWSASSGFELGGLSMGMSNDFEVAIEEGATWVRLGRLLFGRRNGC